MIGVANAVPSSCLIYLLGCHPATRTILFLLSPSSSAALQLSSEGSPRPFTAAPKKKCCFALTVRQLYEYQRSSLGRTRPIKQRGEEEEIARNNPPQPYSCLVPFIYLGGDPQRCNPEHQYNSASIEDPSETILHNAFKL